MTKNELLLKLIAQGVDSKYEFKRHLYCDKVIIQAICNVYDVVYPWEDGSLLSKSTPDELDLWDMAVEQCHTDARKLMNKLIQDEIKLEEKQNKWLAALKKQQQIADG